MMCLPIEGWRYRFFNGRRDLFYPLNKLFYFVLSVLVLLAQVTVAAAQNENVAADPVRRDDEKLQVLIDEGEIDRRVGEVDRQVTSSAYSVIDAERLRNGFTSLPKVLEQEVGVQMRTTGGEGSLSTVTLRGVSNEQVIIYLDGVALNDASGGPVDLSLIPVNSIERIEIYRGSTPLVLGSPSIGGAVNIVTRKSDKTDSSQIAATAGSFQTYKLSGSASLSYEKDDVLLSASYLQSENDFTFVNDNGTQFNPADDREEKRNNDGVKHLTLLGDWKHRINEKVDTELRLDVFNREKEIPSVTNSPDVQTSLDTRQFNFLGQLNARDVWSKDVNLNIKLFATHKDEVFDDSLAQIGFFNQHTESITNKIGTQLLAEINQPQSQWKLLTALSRETYDQESTQALVESGINTRDRLELSAEKVSYFHQQRLILNFILRYQVLYDEMATVTDDFGTVTPGFETTYKLPSPQFGAKYRFDKGTFVTANIGIYNRAPSFFELFGGDGLLLGNPDLKQETSINTDIGLTYSWYKPYHWLHDAEIYAGLFYNQIEDLIVRIYNGHGVGVPENISDAVIQGFETTIKVYPAKNHSINANISLIDSINKTDVASFDGKILPGYYQYSMGLRYSYSLSRWLFSTEADIKRDMYYDRSNLLKGDDVNRINVAIRRYFNHSNIDFRIDNILDENIRYFRNRPTPGLTLSLTYNHTF